jgi:hypothetical protein
MNTSVTRQGPPAKVSWKPNGSLNHRDRAFRRPAVVAIRRCLRAFAGSDPHRIAAAHALHAGCRGFEPLTAHYQNYLVIDAFRSTCISEIGAKSRFGPHLGHIWVTESSLRDSGRGCPSSPGPHYRNVAEALARSVRPVT